jgi:hypothetical protein
MRALLALLSFSLFACEIESGSVGKKPTDKVLSSQKKEEPGAKAAYQDPYADGKELATRREAAKSACAQASNTLSALDLGPLRLKADEKTKLTTMIKAFETACAAPPEEIAALLSTFGDLSLQALSYANDYRGKSFGSVDLLTGNVDTSKVKEEKAFNAAADATEAAGLAAQQWVMSYVMYAPLEQRKQAAASIFLLVDKLPPDYGDSLRKKKLGEAMTAEGDEGLRAQLRAEVYGTPP